VSFRTSKVPSESVSPPWHLHSGVHMILCLGRGRPCALHDVQQHLWPPPSRWQQHLRPLGGSTQKCPQTLPTVPWGAKLTLEQNHRTKRQTLRTKHNLLLLKEPKASTAHQSLNEGSSASQTLPLSTEERACPGSKANIFKPPAQ